MEKQDYECLVSGDVNRAATVLRRFVEQVRKNSISGAGDTYYDIQFNYYFSFFFRLIELTYAMYLYP